MLEIYLAELERELAHHLPAEDIPARLAEAEAHLRDGVEGRIELGLSPLEAEREAIEAFGRIQTVAKAAAPVVSPWPRAKLVLAGYALGALLAFCPSIWRSWGRTIEIAFGAWILLGLIYAILAFRARCPAPLPILATGVTGAIIVWLGTGIYVAVDAGRLIHPAEMAEYTDYYRQEIAKREKDEAKFDATLRRVRGPEGIESQKREGGYWAPPLKGGWSGEEKLWLELHKDPQRALKAWENADRKARIVFRTDKLQKELNQAQNAQWNPLVSLNQSRETILKPNLAVAGGVIVLEFAAGGLGLLVSALRRRNGKGGLFA